MTIKQVLIGTALLAVVTGAFAAPFQKSGKHKISPAQASQIALKKFKGKLTGTPKLEHEDGKWQYEVFIKVGKKLKEVNVNADTGKIGSVEDTTAAEEAREKKAEKKGEKEKGEKEEKD